MPAWVSLCFTGRAGSSLTQPPPCPSGSPSLSACFSVLSCPALRHWESTARGEAAHQGEASESNGEGQTKSSSAWVNPADCPHFTPHLLATSQDRRPGEGVTSLGKRGPKLAYFSDGSPALPTRDNAVLTQDISQSLCSSTTEPIVPKIQMLDVGIRGQYGSQRPDPLEQSREVQGARNIVAWGAWSFPGLRYRWS